MEKWNVPEDVPRKKEKKPEVIGEDENGNPLYRTGTLPEQDEGRNLHGHREFDPYQ